MIKNFDELKSQYEDSAKRIEDSADIILELDQYKSHQGVVMLSEMLTMLEAFRETIEKNYFDINGDLTSRDLVIIKVMKTFCNETKELLFLCIESKQDLLGEDK